MISSIIPLGRRAGSKIARLSPVRVLVDACRKSCSRHIVLNDVSEALGPDIFTMEAQSDVETRFFHA
jgi:hypothetical protein